MLLTIPALNYLWLPDPFNIPDIRRLYLLSCYTTTADHHRVHIIDLLLFRRPWLSPLNLTPPGRNQCHHYPIYQIRALPDERRFVPRAAEEEAVRSHYR